MTNYEKIKEFFNNISPYWHNMKDDFEIINYLLYEAKIKEGEMVLDLGCGKGIITKRLYEITKKKVIGMDISDKMIESAIINHKAEEDLEFICANFYEYDFKNKFDSIVIYNAYPHFLDVGLLDQKAYQILNKNGKLVIMHSLGRSRLNRCHEDIMDISRNLDEIKKEALLFKHFKATKIIDDSDKILLLLEK